MRSPSVRPRTRGTSRVPPLPPAANGGGLLSDVAHADRRPLFVLVVAALGVAIEAPSAAACGGGGEYESVTVKAEIEPGCIDVIETGPACRGNGYILVANFCDTRAWIVGWSQHAIAVEPKQQAALELGRQKDSLGLEVPITVCSGPTPPPPEAMPPALPPSEDRSTETSAGEQDASPSIVAGKPLPCVGADSAPHGIADFVVTIDYWREDRCGTCRIGAYQAPRYGRDDGFDDEESDSIDAVAPPAPAGCAASSLVSSSPIAFWATVAVLLLRRRRKLPGLRATGGARSR